MLLNNEQIKQVELQVRAHKHQRYCVDIELTPGVSLKDFIVLPKVLRPEVMSALQLTQWLYYNNGLYICKKVIDMGCGSGIQGIIAGLYGASKVIFADIAQDAVLNSRENVRQYNLDAKSCVVQSNLFGNVSEKADLIIFNHPFFSDGSMEEQITTDFSKLDRGELIHRFFDDAKTHLLLGGKIIMPYYHLAGPVNDPGVQAPRHGYRLERRWHMKIDTGLQKGWHSIYELST